MPPRPPRRPGSAHALAFVALLVALGGGYAVAQDEARPRQTVGYHSASKQSTEPPAARSSLVRQLVVPSARELAVNAKLNVRKRRTRGFSAGQVECFLAGAGRVDRAAVTLRRGEIATLALSAMGSSGGAPDATRAIDLYCETGHSRYVVSDVRISAITLDRRG